MGRDCEGFWLLFPVLLREVGEETEEVEKEEMDMTIGGVRWGPVPLGACRYPA